MTTPLTPATVSALSTDDLAVKLTTRIKARLVEDGVWTDGPDEDFLFLESEIFLLIHDLLSEHR